MLSKTLEYTIRRRPLSCSIWRRTLSCCPSLLILEWYAIKKVGIHPVYFLCIDISLQLIIRFKAYSFSQLRRRIDQLFQRTKNQLNIILIFGCPAIVLHQFLFYFFQLQENVLMCQQHFTEFRKNSYDADIYFDGPVPI
jgi:hypothetical protein